MSSVTGVQPVRDPIYDPLAPDVLADPFRYYERLRDTTPVYWHAQLDSWVVTGYHECREVLSDITRFGSDFRRVGYPVPDAQLSIQSLDPPAHAPIRHLIVAALHEQSPQRGREYVRGVVGDRLRPLRRGGRGLDLVTEVARPVALSTICHILGVPMPEGARFEALSHAIVRSMDAGLDPARAQPGDQARAELSRLVSGWLDADGPDGPDTLIGAIRRTRHDQPVPAEVIANSLRAVLHAGYESASRLLGNAMLTLIRNPWLLAGPNAARADPPAEPPADLLAAPPADLPAEPPADLPADPAGGPMDEVDALLEELIRLDGPVQADARVCVRDTSLGGRGIARGDVIVLLLAAADRDPAVFPDPDRVVLTRRRGLHLAFGKGPHACLGTAIAGMQLRAVLAELRALDATIVLDGEPVRDDTATLRGLRSLPVVAVPGRSAAPPRSTDLTGQPS